MDESAKPAHTAETAWEQGWEGHRLLQLQRLAELSLAEKLVWLEEADRLVRHMQSKAADCNED